LVPYLIERYNEVYGIDLSPQMLAVAKRRWIGLKGVVWIEGDAQALELPDNQFDVVTVAYGVRNWPDFNRGLQEVYRVMKPGGVVAILEFGQPRNRPWRAIFNLYSRFVIPNLGGVLSGNRDAYSYLHRTAGVFPCGDTFVNELIKVGFKDTKARALAGGVAFCYFAKKPV
jgi:demethylmenaquinone methyltransferase/2-methoxy-6-polyprenyl-1,4-benzoquinol methylase